GERETLPSIVLDPRLETLSEDDERETAPYPALRPPEWAGALGEDAPTRLMSVASGYPGATFAPELEMVTAQDEVGSEPDLPSVLVGGAPRPAGPFNRVPPGARATDPPAPRLSAPQAPTARANRETEGLASVPRALPRRAPEEITTTDH